MTPSQRIAAAILHNCTMLNCCQRDRATWAETQHQLWRRAERRRCVNAVKRLVMPTFGVREQLRRDTLSIGREATS